MPEFISNLVGYLYSGSLNKSDEYLNVLLFKTLFYWADICFTRPGDYESFRNNCCVSFRSNQSLRISLHLWMNNMKSFKLKMLGLIAIFTFGISTADASVIVYNFTATSGNYGSFSYDNTAVSSGNGPYPPSIGIAYDALNFSINGVNITNPLLVIYLNYNNNQDIYFTNTSGFPNYVQLVVNNTGLFSSGDASEMDGRSLSDFSYTALNLLYTSTGSYALTSLTSSTVPEPATLALTCLGLLSIAAVRRRKYLAS